MDLAMTSELHNKIENLVLLYFSQRLYIEHPVFDSLYQKVEQYNIILAFSVCNLWNMGKPIDNIEICLEFIQFRLH